MFTDIYLSFNDEQYIIIIAIVYPDHTDPDSTILATPFGRFSNTKK